MSDNHNYYRLEDFQFMTYHKTRFVIYGYGPWYCHTMDWLGMNIYHGRLPDSPVFDTINEAWHWLVAQVQSGKLTKGMDLAGHHAGEFECTRGCDDREVTLKGLGDLIPFVSVQYSKRKRVSIKN